MSMRPVTVNLNWNEKSNKVEIDIDGIGKVYMGWAQAKKLAKDINKLIETKTKEIE